MTALDTCTGAISHCVSVQFVVFGQRAVLHSLLQTLLNSICVPISLGWCVILYFERILQVDVFRIRTEVYNATHSEVYVLCVYFVSCICLIYSYTYSTHILYVQDYCGRPYIGVYY